MDWFFEHIYELCIGLGLVLTTVFNRRKPTSEEIKQKNAKAVAKLEKKSLKRVAKVQDDMRKIEELKKED